MAKTLHAGDAGLDRSPSHLLHRALQLALDIYAEETGTGALTQRQFAVLSAVMAKEGCTQSELVRATGIDRSTLAELVARLIGKDLLARERSTLDARANTVRLTDAGRAAVHEAGPKVAQADERIMGLVPGAKRDAFIKTLRDMARAAGKSEAGESDDAKKAKKAAKADKPVKADRPDKKKKKKKAKKKADEAAAAA
ncbi:MAG TPA: MarR family winged helix-turn-helix transcriptional regulator [Caulobacteraceae bacterium]|jgi:DNA-binding MarR family transcriptional regulator